MSTTMKTGKRVKLAPLSFGEVVRWRDDAAVHGDMDLVTLCNKVLDGNATARGKLTRIIRDTEANRTAVSP